MDYFKKILFIGLGKIALKHIKIMNQLYPKIEIHVLRSGKGQKQLISKKYQLIKNFDEIKKKKFNAIFITSPSSTHHSILKKIYREKSSLFIEKPIFNKLENIGFILKSIKENKIVNQVGYVFRHDEVFLKFKNLLKKNLIGKIIHINIYCGSSLNNWKISKDPKKSIYVKKNTGGGVLLELSHEIDYALWLFGKFKEVDASLYNTKTFGNQVEDTANIVLTNFKNQRINIHLNFWQKNSERLCVVYGTQGTMKIDIIKRKIYINNNKKRIINFSSKFQESYKKQIKNFVSSIKNKKRTRIDIEDSIESLKIIEKIRLSNKLNKRVRI